MSRGFMATKSEQAAMRTAQQCRAEMCGVKTYGMYLPQKQNSAIDLETLPDLKLRLGLCAKSGGNLSVCRQCGAPCSFGRILMEREDSVSQAAGAEVNSNVSPDWRMKGTKSPNVSPDGRKKAVKPPKPQGLETGDSPEAVQRRKEHAMKVSLAAAEARRRRAAENASKPRNPEETKEEYKRRKQAEYMRTYYHKHRERMAAYNREYKRMCAQRKAEQEAEKRTARAARTDLPVKDTFAARLDLSLYNHGMTNADMAQELHVQETTARSWVTGSHTPTLDSLASVCKLLGVSADWLLGLEEGHHD